MFSSILSTACSWLSVILETQAFADFFWHIRRTQTTLLASSNDLDMVSLTNSLYRDRFDQEYAESMDPRAGCR